VIDALTRIVLENAVRREGRSLLQYVSESFPWTTTEEQQALAQLQELVRQQRDATAALAQYLAKQEHSVPYLGSFPMSFTNINFVSLDHTLPLLLEAERQGLAYLERDLAKVQDPAARDHLLKIADMKRQHCVALKALAAHHEAAKRVG
jgi:hypothetical protein